MTREEQIQFCRKCLNRKFDPSVGLICGVTMAKANFSGQCADFSMDAKESASILHNELKAQQSYRSGPMTLEKRAMSKGVVGGILMIVVAVIWFVGGLAINRIFFYPPVLAVLGIITLIRGISQGNLAGK